LGVNLRGKIAFIFRRALGYLLLQNAAGVGHLG
jgi:hypothetical protein